VTSASVTGLWRFRKLRQLNLSETVVTDDDVATLASLSELTVLNLFGTEVTDDCLSILQQIPSLKRVYLWRTAVTPAAARQLADARPDLLVDIGQPLPPSDSEGGEDVEAEDVDSVEESRAQEGEKEL
jgi:hypothetical protein